ncbi:hypothetical protein K0M31_007300 [Melipona bicolor]|uniref:Uncharacterized protein n=1 Tax=Melipona bicolor TaxID=60889 RepID=A0AA40KVN9_9HYME|nr:hypothetical protein K0M31_007300 [Melipona bicolor]
MFAAMSGVVNRVNGNAGDGISKKGMSSNGTPRKCHARAREGKRNSISDVPLCSFRRFLLAESGGIPFSSRFHGSCTIEHKFLDISYDLIEKRFDVFVISEIWLCLCFATFDLLIREDKIFLHL